MQLNSLGFAFFLLAYIKTLPTDIQLPTTVAHWHCYFASAVITFNS